MSEHSYSRRDFLRALIGAPFAAGALLALPDQAEAATDTIYVVKTIKVKASMYTELYNFTYNRNGLLTKRSDRSKVLEKMTYKRKRLTSVWKDGGEGAPSSWKLGYKNGEITKLYNKGDRAIKVSAQGGTRISKMTQVFSSHDKVTTTYTYGAKGRIASCRYSTWGNNALELAYDAKGNLRKIYEYWNDGDTTAHVTTCKNTYRNGRLTRIVIKDDTGGKTTVVISYKKVRIPSAYKTTVKKQQASILTYYGSGAGSTALYYEFYRLPLGTF